MTDQIDWPLGMFTSAETPILPAQQVTPTPFISPIYPTQLGVPPVFGLAGEQRGFYAGNKWVPKWCGFMFPRPTGVNHGGVDIFAPRGTPLVAMIDGAVEQVSSENAMGLRAHLTFKFAGVAYRFILGHLDRFEGGPRSVTKGIVSATPTMPQAASHASAECLWQVLYAPSLAAYARR
ncbi:hypothetical protein H7F50_13830 [Novosphingobium flavum]|uniref:hypothetical protein n=1 Tax=Novosphingobium aerophilum TaxID=2839843 RepID=UPI0016398AA9|nr:hypothetical protein [Novosphingobium aerophilum]MBC2662833.1 hypothetical protein [Novosphingobium aerophilum]